MIPANHITILIKNLTHGGAQKVCITLCNELIKRNHSVELWMLENKETELTRQLNAQTNITCLNKRKVRHSSISLYHLLKTRKPSQILVFNIELAIVILILKKLFRFKTRVYFRSINTLSQVFNMPRNNIEKHITSKLIRWVLPMSDKIIAQSTGMKNDLLLNFKIDEKKIITIHNPAVNLPEEISNTFTAINDKSYFLFVGRLMPQKGVDNLIKIFALALKQNPDLQLLILGDGNEKEHLMELINKLDLSSVIHMIGYKCNTADYFRNATATVLTSNYEGFPNVLVESIALGTPVISFNCPSGPEDIIEPGINGILVPNQNLQAFSEAILAVANDEVRFDKQKIIESSKKFSIQDTVNKYEAILEQL